MIEDLVCWKCGATLADLPQPLARRATCPACRGELHVCRMCRHFDPGKAKQCREPVAEDVADKTRANFCDWFQPRPHAFTPADTPKAEARGALDALFGGAAPSPAQAGDALNRLFDD